MQLRLPLVVQVQCLNNRIGLIRPIGHILYGGSNEKSISYYHNRNWHSILS